MNMPRSANPKPHMKQSSKFKLFNNFNNFFQANDEEGGESEKITDLADGDYSPQRMESVVSAVQHYG